LAEFKKIGISSDQIVAVILQDGILKMHPVKINIQIKKYYSKLKNQLFLINLNKK
jgi:hypothetical protein